MFLTHIKLTNWRNFRDVDVPLHERTFLLGANASGKSNFMDVFRFLRDISKTQGGGLQKAVTDRGEISKLRCLHARQNPEISIEVHLANDPDSGKPDWRYKLAFKPEGKGKRRTLISCEKVWKGEELLINRPSKDDMGDPQLLTQTDLENVRSNAPFREIADYFSKTTYLHLVPQLLKYGERMGGQLLEDDPFGQGFLDRVAKTSEKTRDARLRKIEKALEAAIPQFQKLQFDQDPSNGHPHLKALYAHHRPNAGWQREEQFSDGTLRLLGLLWSLLEGDSLLLLEEPELSLNNAIVEQIPLMLKRVLRDNKRRRQVIVSTHSDALLSDRGIDARGVLLLEPSQEGTKIRQVNKREANAIHAGLSVAEVVLPKTQSEKAGQLGLWG